MPICELNHITKSYGSGAAKVLALNDISLSFEAGEFTAICGPSGSGKTTMLNLIGLLDAPTKGSLTLEGKAISGLDAKSLAQIRAKRIGFIFQSFNLIPVLTTTENVEMALHLSYTAGDRRTMAIEALKSVGLGDMLNRRPSQLSGGQQQRVAVARALVKKPALVIADEPTANLDSKTGGQIMDLMRKMNEEQNITFLLSTHDPMVMGRALRVVTLRDGIIYQGEAKDILEV